jgi:hypothetical protein
VARHREHAVLHHIGRILVIAADFQAESINLRLMPREQLLQCGAVAGARTFQQRWLSQVRHASIMAEGERRYIAPPFPMKGHVLGYAELVATYQKK